MKREFKDLVRFEHYDSLNSEITGDYDKDLTPHYLLDIVAARKKP